MFILNQYLIGATDPAAAPAAVVNVNPDVITGASGDSVAGSTTTPIRVEAEYLRQMVGKLVSIYIPVDGLTAAQDNFITVPLEQLGVKGIRTLIAALLLGVYDEDSIQQAGAGATPSFIGMYDKTEANENCLSVVNDILILKIPVAQIDLFSDKFAQVMLWYHST